MVDIVIILPIIAFKSNFLYASIFTLVLMVSNFNNKNLDSKIIYVVSCKHICINKITVFIHPLNDVIVLFNIFDIWFRYKKNVNSNFSLFSIFYYNVHVQSACMSDLIVAIKYLIRMLISTVNTSDGNLCTAILKV